MLLLAYYIKLVYICGHFLLKAPIFGKRLLKHVIKLN